MGANPVRTFPWLHSNLSFSSSYKHVQANLQRLFPDTITNRLLTRWHSLKRSHSHLPIIHRVWLKKKCSQRRFSQPPSVSGTNPATRTVGGACRKVVSFSSHWRHTGGDRAGERQTNGREGELCGCRQNERERERNRRTDGEKCQYRSLLPLQRRLCFSHCLSVCLFVC